MVNGCNYHRPNLLDAALTAILGSAAANHKRLLVAAGDDEDTPRSVHSRAFLVEMDAFTPADYESICRTYLTPAAAACLDCWEIHRLAHQLSNACLWLNTTCSIDMARFIEHLAEQNMTSNVELEQVAPVDRHDLKGFEDVIRTLEVKIALPFENRRLAAELQLKPKTRRVASPALRAPARPQLAEHWRPASRANSS